MFSQLFLALKCKTEKRGFSFFFWLNPISRWQDESCLYRCVEMCTNISNTKDNFLARHHISRDREKILKNWKYDAYWKCDQLTALLFVLSSQFGICSQFLRFSLRRKRKIWEIKATLLIKIRYSTLSSSSCHLFILEDVLMSLRDGFPDRRPTKTKHVSDFKLGLELQFKILMSLIAL